MPRVAKKSNSRKESKKNESQPVIDEETDATEKPVVVIVDKIEEECVDEPKTKKGIKRKASAPPATKVKKISSVSSTNGDDNAGNTQEIENETQQPVTMTLKTSDRLSAKGEKATLKLVSWNVNGIRAWINNGGLNYVEQEQPDMICFQEMKCDKDKIPIEATPHGYKAFWLSGDTAGYSGVGILTKTDPINVTFGIGMAEHDNEGRVITAEYEKFYFIVSYIPNSGRKLVRLTYRQQFDEAFHAYLKRLDKIKPVIWCGDLNVSHQSIDLANPKTNSKNAGFTAEEREDFSKILADGFLDSYRHLYPDERDVYTYWAYFRNARSRNIGWRLDYFIISSRLEENLCDVIIQNGVFGSDHCPIVLLLAI